MKKYFTLILILFLTLSASSQLTTAYEKKCYTLKVQFLKTVGVDESLLKRSNDLKGLEALMTANDLIRKVNTEKGMLLLLQLERDLKDAEKLKTPEERRKFELEAQNNQVLKLKEEARRKYENSDYANLNRGIQEQFNKWSQKGEFEKKIDYERRISDSSEVYFDYFCVNNLATNRNWYLDRMNSAFRNDRDSKFNLTPLKYDTETEIYSLELLFNGLRFNTSLSVPIDEAKFFKQNLTAYEQFEIYLDCKDFVFYENYIVPTKVYLISNKAKHYYKIALQNQNFKQVSFSNPNTKVTSQSSYTFNLDDYYKLKMNNTADISEKINSLGWKLLLDSKFENAKKTLEEGIKFVEKNDGNYPFLLGNLAHAYLFNNQFEKAHKIYFENLSFKLNNMSWKEAVLQDFEEFKTRGIRNPDMEKIKKEFLSIQ